MNILITLITEFLCFTFTVRIKKYLRSRQGSNLRGKIPLDFKSNALTTRPRLLVTLICENTEYHDSPYINQKMEYFAKIFIAIQSVRVLKWKFSTINYMLADMYIWITKLLLVYWKNIIFWYFRISLGYFYREPYVHINYS